MSLIPSSLTAYLYDRVALAEWRAIEEFFERRQAENGIGIYGEPARTAVHDVLMEIIRAREEVERRVAFAEIQPAPQVESASTLSDSSVQTPEFPAKGGLPQS